MSNIHMVNKKSHQKLDYMMPNVISKLSQLKVYRYVTWLATRESMKSSIKLAF